MLKIILVLLPLLITAWLLKRKLVKWLRDTPAEHYPFEEDAHYH